MDAPTSPMGELAAENERRRRRLRLASQLSKALAHTFALLLVGVALVALFEGAWLLFIDCLQTIALICSLFWGLDLRRRLHAIETGGLKLDLQVQAELVPVKGPPFAWDKKHPPERAN